MEKVDFIIIGQGLAGTMLAFEMWQNRISFKIIASPHKSKASEVAAGMINPLVFKRLTKSWMVDKLLPVMKEKYRQLEALLGESFYFEKDMLKPLSEQEMLLWKERSEDFGFSKYIQSVSKNNTFEYLRESAGIGRVIGSGYVNLSVFLKAAEQFFRKNDLLMDATFSFQEFNPSANSFVVEKYSTSKIIFCEGFHVVSNPWFDFVILKPVKGEVLTIHSPDLPEAFILNKKVFVLPFGNHRFKVGSTYDWDDLTEQPTELGKRSIVERLERLINVEYTIENHQAGIRPTVIDRRPVIGAHPVYKNLAVFNGLGTKGVMLAPYFARETLNLLTNKNYSVNPEVNINRFLSSNFS